MARAISASTLRLLRWLDERADKIRREHGLNQRGETVAWQMSETDPGRFFEVLAGGYGQFTLIDYKGINPNDREVIHEAQYGDEETAWRAARRLGESGVSWAERDIDLGEAEDLLAPEPAVERAQPVHDASPGG